MEYIECIIIYYVSIITLPSHVGDLAESDDDAKNGAELAEHILRDFNHDIRCKLMEKDRGLKVSGIFWEF